MSTYCVELDPVSNLVVHIKLVINIKNAQSVKKKLLNNQMECCLIRPNLICDPFQVVVAANKAVTSKSLKTKTIYTETLYNLSVSKNITQSLQKFGMNEEDREALIVTIHSRGLEDPVSKMMNDVEGDVVDISKLSELCDIDAIKKAYKISETEARETSLTTSVVSRIATKDFISH